MKPGPKPGTRKLADVIGKRSPCPVCGKPRSTGLRFIDHGKCAERAAASDLEHNYKETSPGHRISKEAIRKQKAKRNAKRYISGASLKYLTGES